MSKLLYASFRVPQPNLFSDENVELLSKSLEPDNISFSPPKIIRDRQTIIAIFNPNQSLSIERSSVCLGQMIAPEPDWWNPMGNIPNGSYALFRGNEDYIKVSTDAVASRSVWYFYDEALFIASTSQRAIVFFLRTFEFNRAVIPWMLSTGTLGLGNSWDRRIKFLEGNSSILLEQASWRLTCESESKNLLPAPKLEVEHENDLKRALVQVFDLMKLDYSKWVLPLSGGYDSRGILCLLQKSDHFNRLKCITWGLERSQFDETNDAFIAKKLSQFFGLEHKYLLTDVSNEGIEILFNRFLVCGEGRVDHISAYMDGFKVWKTLFEEGVEGVIRGDHGFGRSPATTPLEVRRLNGIMLVSDLANLSKIYKSVNNAQEFPNHLDRQYDESLESWRDRLHLQFRIPYVLSALSDLKTSYVEVINPLLVHSVISVVQNLPDSLRTSKQLFRKIVNSLSPNISYAKRPAINNPTNILGEKEVVEFITAELSHAASLSIFPDDFIRALLININEEKYANGKPWSLLARLQKKAKSVIKWIFKLEDKNQDISPGLNVDYNILAFRAYVIYSMYRMLTSDAKRLVRR